MIQTLRSVSGGLVASLLSLSYAFSYGALIFSGPLRPFLGQGVAAALITAAVTATIVALTGSFRSAVAGPDSNTAALLAAMMVILGPAMSTMPPDRAFALAMAGLSATTMITGFALLVLGWRRLGKLIRFVPYPVFAGFLAATGWLMISGAVNMATGVPLSWPNLQRLASPHTFFALGLVALWAATLGFVTARWRHPLVLPAALMAAILATYVILTVLALPPDIIAASGLMFSDFGRVQATNPLIISEYFFVDWTALVPVAGEMVAVAVIGILSILLNSTSIELATGIDADLDRELRIQGLANVASALLGGFVGHISVSRTLVNIAAGGVTRLSGVVVGLVALVVLIGGGQVMSYVPPFVLAGLVLHLGVRLIWDWGLLSRRGLPLRDWFVVVAIVLITANFGFLQALLFGMIAGCIIFAIDLSHIQPVRHQFGLDERSSPVVRSKEEGTFLLENGGQVQVIELSGNLFFGSAHSLMERVKALVTDRKPTVLVFDFSSVAGIDSSAGAAFAKIRKLLRKSGIHQVMTALSLTSQRVLSVSSGLDTDVRCYEHLEKALEDAEETLLAKRDASHGQQKTMVDWLEVVVGSRECAQELFAQLTPATRSAGSYICRQGDPTDSLLFIERGAVSVMLERKDSSPLRMRVFGAHTLVGEVGFFLDAPRSASLYAPTDTIVWSLNREVFQQFRKTRPENALALLTYVIGLQSERLTFANRQIAALER
jgi:sulfate permease, SulP family